ncbi:MAG: 50S ribosome-binding GTPase [Dehalococcoidales bacterium]|nr:50S ribosome-binding GTPase [Dehalococcoidales bacterium]
MAKEITIALAGNPNSGKTTVFNNLTGAHQHVGNWPGVTVEKKEGSYRYQGYEVRVVDLPGVYSLSAYSPDEVVARNFILEGSPDVVVDIVDGSNLERNLYLTVQLMELEAKLVVALNMMDVAKSRGYEIDIDGLSRELGAPVVPMIAKRRVGHQQLLQEIVSVYERGNTPAGVRLYYGSELEEHIAELEEILARDEMLSHRFPPRWLAIKLLEEDSEVLDKIGLKT